HVLQPHRVDHRHADLATHGGFLLSDFSFCLLEGIEKSETRIEESLPLGRHHEWALRAIDQLRAQLFLKLPDSLTCRRLRNAMSCRPQGKTAGTNHIAIKAQRLQIHN